MRSYYIALWCSDSTGGSNPLGLGLIPSGATILLDKLNHNNLDATEVTVHGPKRLLGWRQVELSLDSKPETPKLQRIMRNKY